MTDVRIPGLVLTDHAFDVPLDHSRPHGDTIRVYAREVTTPRGAQDRPWLVFFQGGPGFEAFRPLDKGVWVGRALEDYRVLLLDQRGTGRSTPVRAETVGHLPPGDLAEYLTHFRADSIVADAEAIRRQLIGDGQWSILGQSFGGFCATTYLSRFPESLSEVFITGGLPPLTATPEEFYQHTFPRMARRSAEFARQFPTAPSMLRRIVDALADGSVTCPDGSRLAPERFQQVGGALGRSDGFAELYYLLEDAFVDTPGGPRLSNPFIRAVWTEEPFETNPIYAVLHEACLGNGMATKWSAQRVRDASPEFDPRGDGAVTLTGEGVFPWMFEELPLLRPFAEAAEILAHHEWPALYDPEVLARNAVPAAAALYYDDMFVERVFSEQTAAAIPNLRLWVTNEYEHNGIRADGARVLGTLIDMVRGER